jgi:hypothetical protein
VHLLSIFIAQSARKIGNSRTKLLPPSWNIRHSMIQNLSPNIRHHRNFWQVPNQLN